jgi:hypothetical protein
MAKHQHTRDSRVSSPLFLGCQAAPDPIGRNGDLFVPDIGIPTLGAWPASRSSPSSRPSARQDRGARSHVTHHALRGRPGLCSPFPVQVSGAIHTERHLQEDEHRAEHAADPAQNFADEAYLLHEGRTR